MKIVTILGIWSQCINADKENIISSCKNSKKFVQKDLNLYALGIESEKIMKELISYE